MLCCWRRYDLGNLLFKMKQLDKAERVLLEAVERVGGGRSGTGDAVAVGHVELATLIEGARSMALLARINEELGRTPDAIRMLKDSRELQGRYITMLYEYTTYLYSSANRLSESIFLIGIRIQLKCLNVSY